MKDKLIRKIGVLINILIKYIFYNEKGIIIENTFF